MGVSKNIGTPKSSILKGVSIMDHPFWGPTTIFGNIHIEVAKSNQVVISFDSGPHFPPGVPSMEVRFGRMTSKTSQGNLGVFRDLCWLFCFCQRFFGNQPVPEGIDENVFLGIFRSSTSVSICITGIIFIGVFHPKWLLGFFLFPFFALYMVLFGSFPRKGLKTSSF